MKCLTKLSVCLVFVTVTQHGVKAGLLDACTGNNECRVTDGDPNAVCAVNGEPGGDDNGNCICTGAYKNNANNDGCVAKGLLDACTNSDECRVTEGDQNAVCAVDGEPGGDANGNCICTGAYKNNANDDGCVAKGLLDACTNNNECRVTGGDPNAVCAVDGDAGGDNDGNCICTGAFKNNANNDGCVAKVITDYECTPGSTGDGTTKCQGADPNAVCPESTNGNTNCDCKADYFLSSDETQCVQSIEEVTCTPGEAGDTKCGTQTQNAECPSDSTTCACKADYFLNSDKKTCTQQITTVDCTPGTDGTAACEQVDTNSECPAGGKKCACKDGYAGTDSCAKVITDTTCTPGDAVCQGVDSNAECPTGSTTCACKDEYFLNSDKTQCLQKITMVDCTPGTDGTAACEQVDEHSECPAGGTKCACKAGYSGTDSCTLDARSSASTIWMSTNLIVISLLVYLPRLCW